MRARAVAAVVMVTMAVSIGATGCVGVRANNDGPKVPGEDNPAQPYEQQRRDLEREHRRGG